MKSRRQLLGIVKRLLSTKGRPERVAVVGSGPAGFYFTGALRKQRPDVEVNVLEADPVPFGLVRYGVAPDHADVKNCTHQFQGYLEKAGDRVQFLGNVRVGSDVSVDELRDRHDAVVFATGASLDVPFDVEGQGSGCKNVVTARRIVAWYNGHPDSAGEEDAHIAHLLFTSSKVMVVGLGNVAVDVARLLLCDPERLVGTDIAPGALQTLRRAHSLSRVVELVGRRGPLEAAFTIKEIRELLRLPGLTRPPRIGTAADFAGLDEARIATLPRPKRRLAQLLLDSHRKSCLPEETRDDVNDGDRSWDLRFYRSPMSVELEKGRVTGLRCSVNRPIGEGRIEDSGERQSLSTQLLVPSIGYRAQA